MFQKKILVPLGPSGRNLKSVHYALSLAERLHSQVFILQQASSAKFENPIAFYLDEALSDLINSARQAGLTVSHHITQRELMEEIVGLVKEEGIDLLVFSPDEGVSERLLRRMKTSISPQIIRVKEKNHISYL